MASVPLAQLTQCLTPNFAAIGLFESLDVLAADEGCVVDDGLDGRIDLGLEGLVLDFEVHERDVHHGMIRPFSTESIIRHLSLGSPMNGFSLPVSASPVSFPYCYPGASSERK